MAKRRILATALMALMMVPLATGCATPRGAPIAIEAQVSDDQLLSDLEAETARGVMPGAIVYIAKDNQIIVHVVVGSAEPGGKAPLSNNAIFRLYSMTKPITSVAVLILAERGLLSLDDPASKLLPELADMRVYRSGGLDDMVTSPPVRAITIADLLSHSSGIVYHFTGNSPVHQYYRQHGVLRDTPVGRRPDDGAPAGNLDELVRRIGKAPLLFDLGDQFHYSYSTTVLGALIERASGKRLDDFLRHAIFDPLEMTETGFFVDDTKLDRFTPLYAHTTAGLKLAEVPNDSDYRGRDRLLDGGGALAGTASDYLRFAMMLANSGELEGVRILSRTSAESMFVPRARVGQVPGATPTMFGYGFAIGNSDSGMETWYPDGTFGWSGSGNTHFLVNPSRRSAVLLMTNVLMGPDNEPARTLQPIVHAAARRAGAF